MQTPASSHVPTDAVIDRKLWVDFHSFPIQVHTVLAGNDFVFLSKLYEHTFLSAQGRVNAARVDHVPSTSLA